MFSLSELDVETIAYVASILFGFVQTEDGEDTI